MVKSFIKRLLPLLFLFSFLFAKAQSATDSLIAAAKTMHEDTSKATTLIKIGRTFRSESNFTAAYEYLNSGYKLSEKLLYTTGIINSLYSLGLTYYDESNLTKALDFSLRALTVATKYDKKSLVGRCNNSLGLIYKTQKKYDLALAYFQQSLKIHRSLNDSASIASANSNIGTVYQLTQKDNEALRYYTKALSIDEKLKDRKGIAVDYLNIACIYDNLGSSEKAIEYVNKSLEMRLPNGGKRGIVLCYNNLGDIYLRSKHYKEAVENLTKAAELAHSVSFLEAETASRINLSDAYAKQGKFDLAYNERTRAQKLNDSAFNIENTRQISDLKTKFEVERKEAELAVQDSLNKRNRTIYIIGGITLVLIGFVLIILFYQKRIRHKEKSMYNAILMSQEIERQRIGRDLHDDVGPLLSAVKLTLDGLRKKYSFNDAVDDDVAKVNTILDRAITGVRTSSHNLTPTILQHSGLIGALNEVISDIKHANLISVFFEHNNWPTTIDTSVELNVFRAIQELINNTLKHAQAQNMWVKVLVSENKASIVVADDGIGFDPDNIGGSEIGLQNIKGRIRLLKGSIHINSAPGKGCKALINIDLSGFLAENTPLVIA